MDPIYYYLFGATAVVFAILGWYLKVQGKKELLQQQSQALEQNVMNPSIASKPISATNPEMVRLQLQAYERLIILTERMALSNLISKFDVSNSNAVQLQQQLVQTIKTEFEYNVSQQLYVSTTSWDAVKNLKDQNIYIINQIAAMLPPNAAAIDLSKQIAELLAADENASLQPIVSALLQKEAKQLMNAV